MIEFKMPKLGESVTEGTIGRWLKQPGDTLDQYEPMLEVTTDKVDTEVSAPVKGTLVEILVPEGETVSVGTVIARLASADESALESTNGSTDGAATQASTATVAAATQASEAVPVAAPRANAPKAASISPAVARLAAEHNVDLREISGTGGGGRVTKKDIETFVAARTAQPRQPTPSAATARAQRLESRTSERDPHAEGELQQAFEVGVDRESTEQGHRTPLERRIGDRRRLGASPATPASTPPAPAPAPALGPDDELVPLSPMRRAIAEHMVRSKRTAPHVTTVMEADLSRIVAHRAKNKADYERQGVKLTFTPYFVQAVVAALQETPIVNASFSDNGIVMHQRINIGVAVAIPDGLIVPVIKNADEKSLLGLSRAVNDLAERGRTRKLQPDDTQGGTFTITNHGVGGSIFAMPVINQPQAAILGVGAMQKRAVVVSDNGFDALAIRPMCYLSLTFDHRLIDGATADAFLMLIKRALEQYEG